MRPLRDVSRPWGSAHLRMPMHFRHRRDDFDDPADFVPELRSRPICTSRLGTRLGPSREGAGDALLAGVSPFLAQIVFWEGVEALVRIAQGANDT